MPISVVLSFDSGSFTEGDNATAVLEYLIKGTDDDVEAKNALGITAPLDYDELQRKNWSVDRIGNYLWRGSVRYVHEEYILPETGESSFAFDTGGGTQHITQSMQTIAKYGLPGQTAPDFKGAIGVTHDNVEGVDITVPVYNFSETHYLPVETVTQAYKDKLRSLTGKVNDADFKGHTTGECLLLGVAGAQRGADDWEISFRFASSENKTGLTVGEITGIAKKGWEYMWVRYANAEDTTAKALIKKPVAVYIEKVYESGDFSELGIGV